MEVFTGDSPVFDGPIIAELDVVGLVVHGSAFWSPAVDWSGGSIADVPGSSDPVSVSKPVSVAVSVSDFVVSISCSVNLNILFMYWIISLCPFWDLLSHNLQFLLWGLNVKDTSKLQVNDSLFWNASLYFWTLFLHPWHMDFGWTSSTSLLMEMS